VKELRDRLALNDLLVIGETPGGGEMCSIGFADPHC
jgi:hypothetical protein